MEEKMLKDLYINNKKSSFEIARTFRCSENKVNYWLEKYNIPKRSLSDAMYAKYNPNGDPFNIKKIKSLADSKLLGLGLGLYWGEGNKKNKNSIRLGNTNPKIIKKFIQFLIDIFRVKREKLRFGLQVFSDMSTEITLNFWLKELKEFGINREQFFKVTVTPSRSIGSYREKTKFGVLTVHFANVKLKKILDSMLPL